MAKTPTEKSREYSKRYALKHPEKVAANILRQKQIRMERYKTDPEYREKLKAYARARHAKNRDRINERRKTSQKAQDYDRKYRKLPSTRRRVKNHVFKEKYGITIDQYDALLAAQNGGCAICGGTTAFDKWKSGLSNLQVDHCHETGAVRGLLCFHCNTGLGHFRDNAVLLQKALDYLKLSSL